MVIFPKSSSGIRVPWYNLKIPNIWSCFQNQHQVPVMHRYCHSVKKRLTPRISICVAMRCKTRCNGKSEESTIFLQMPDGAGGQGGAGGAHHDGSLHLQRTLQVHKGMTRSEESTVFLAYDAPLVMLGMANRKSNFFGPIQFANSDRLTDSFRPIH